MNFNGLLKNTNVNSCIECGKCTGNCPVSRFNPNFSPRKLLSTFFNNDQDKLLQNELIWSCLTCGMCRVRCPMDVKFTDFTKIIRQKALKTGTEANCAHGGALQSMMKIMTSENLNQNKMEWITDDLEISETGEILFFVGCLPYFDTFFNELKVDTLAIAKSAIHILNVLGIKPVILKNERCCGHDLLWAGDVDNFKKLAEENITEINKIKPRKIIFSCAECYRTFKLDYQELMGPFDFEMMHLSEFISEKMENNNLGLKKVEGCVTYHDPCRLGRHLGVYEPPRKILNAIPDLKYVEMPKNKVNAVCCGTNLWINCDKYSRMIQNYRLKMGRQVGSNIMLTSCPKCYIHFTCAMQGEQIPDKEKIIVKDLAVFTAEAME